MIYKKMKLMNRKINTFYKIIIKNWKTISRPNIAVIHKAFKTLKAPKYQITFKTKFKIKN